MRSSLPPVGYFLAPHITVREIHVAVADAFGVPVLEMISHRRTRKFSRPRQVAMYLSRELTTYSYPLIAKLFGNRDHTTILHGVRVIEALTDTDKDLSEKVETVRSALLAEKLEKHKGSIAAEHQELVAA